MKVVIDDCRLEMMDVYTDPLNDKIKRQAAEITRLLAENAELKNSMEIIRDNAFEAGQVKGQNDAWELAQKIASMKTQEAADCFPEYNFPRSTNGLLNDYTFTEAAAKVAEWERKKEEICIWDEVELVNGVKFFVTYSCNGIVNGVSGSGQFIEGILVQECKKTGRHIDVQEWLAQIGGER